MMGKKRKNSNKSSIGTNAAPISELIVVLPGDDVTKYIIRQDEDDDVNNDDEDDEDDKKPSASAAAAALPKLGTGLQYDAKTQRIKAIMGGKLEKHPNKPVYFVKENTKRYIPAIEDRIIGIVEERIGNDGRGGDLYRLNIGSSHTAMLSNLSFEGATKRNKPSLQPGQLIYARIHSLSNNIDPVLSCQLGPHDGNIPRKDWMTNENCYGELRGGTVCRITTGLSKQLLLPGNVCLQELDAAKIPFEVAVGVNGYLWIHSTSAAYTIMIQNAIQNSYVLTPSQTRAMVKSLVYTCKKQIQQQQDKMEE